MNFMAWPIKLNLIRSKLEKTPSTKEHYYWKYHEAFGCDDHLQVFRQRIKILSYCDLQVNIILIFLINIVQIFIEHIWARSLENSKINKIHSHNITELQI